MRVPRFIGSVFVGVALVSSAAVLRQSLSESDSSTVNPITPPSSTVLDQAPVSAGELAGLVMLCRDATLDSSAAVRYHAALAARPAFVNVIDAACNVRVTDR